MNIPERQPRKILSKLVGQDAPVASSDEMVERAMEKTQQEAQLKKPGLPGATSLERKWATGVNMGINKLNK